MDFINRFITVVTQIHPTHPMIVHFPIALTGAAFLFILLAWWRKNASLEQAAFANMALAALSTIFAGFTGVMDNVKNYEGEAPNAAAKVALAALLFLLTTGISIARFRNPQLFAQGNRALYATAYGLSFLIALSLAFLGGVILYGF
ncbi:MAG: hypothetical protein IT313_07180 [Anaerolineales bacterium]|nr:hypothetical protein [Anaerolineales bacterium]